MHQSIAQNISEAVSGFKPAGGKGRKALQPNCQTLSDAIDFSQPAKVPARLTDRPSTVSVASIRLVVFFFSEKSVAVWKKRSARRRLRARVVSAPWASSSPPSSFWPAACPCLPAGTRWTPSSGPLVHSHAPWHNPSASTASSLLEYLIIEQYPCQQATEETPSPQIY